MTSSKKFPVSFVKNPYPKKRKLLPKSRTIPRRKWFPKGETLETCITSSTPSQAMCVSTEETPAPYKALRRMALP